MPKKLLFFLSIIFFLFLTDSSFSQIKSNRFSFGYSDGYVNTIHLNYSIANHFQLALLIGDIVIDNDFNFNNFGTSFKYFLFDNNLSPYIGFSASMIVKDSIDYYFYLPLGVQKFASKDFAFFLGLNPGIYFNNNIIYLMSFEIGGAFYF
jgi:hypothetical protein